MGKNKTQEKTQSGVTVKERTKTQPPPMYSVLLLNDDYTPMDFVVHVLKKFFNRSDDEAVSIMLQVHNKGSGVAGVYQYEIAEMKSQQVNKYAKANEHPLKSVLEKET